MNRIRSALGLAAGIAVLVAVPTFGLGAVAGAATGDGGTEQRPGPRPQLTDEQRQCLGDQGVTPPERPVDGAPVRPSDEQRAERRAAMKAAAEACGLPERRGPGTRPGRAGEPRQCPDDQGATPDRPSDI